MAYLIGVVSTKSAAPAATASKPFGYRPAGGGQTALIPTLIGSTMFEQNRERYGANIGIQFRPSDEPEINLTGLYSRFNADNFNQNYIAWAIRREGGGTLTNAVVENGIAVSTIASRNNGTEGFGVVYDAIGTRRRLSPRPCRPILI